MESLSNLRGGVATMESNPQVIGSFLNVAMARLHPSIPSPIPCHALHQECCKAVHSGERTTFPTICGEGCCTPSNHGAVRQCGSSWPLPVANKTGTFKREPCCLEKGAGATVGMGQNHPGVTIPRANQLCQMLIFRWSPTWLLCECHFLLFLRARVGHEALFIH